MDDKLSEKISKHLESKNIPFEIKRFGGFNYFMVGGKVISAVMYDKLMIRCSAKQVKEFLKQPNVQVIEDHMGKPVKDKVLVKEDGLKTDEEMHKWLDIGIEFAANNQQ